jgi:NADH-quinone oxidoreductase subunit N
MTPADLSTVLPELVLAIFAMASLLFGAYAGKDDTAPMLTWATTGLFVALAVWIGVNGDGARAAFGGMFVDDPFARFAKITILLSAAAVLAISNEYMQRRGLLRFEFPILVTLSVVGMMMMVSAGDLMSLYMGLELQSLALYVMATMRRDSPRSAEAGLKYFVWGVADLWLCGDDTVFGDPFDIGRRGSPPWAVVRVGVHAVGAGVQSVCSTFSHVDAGCL